MLIDDFFTDTTAKETFVVANSDSLIVELKRWIAIYKDYLRGSKLPTTVENYSITLDAFELYTERYLSELKSIEELTYIHLNDFLEYVEDYRVSKKYGSIKERIAELLFYIKRYEINDLEQAVKFFYPHFVDMEDERIACAQYAIGSFVEFMETRKLYEINKEAITKYIGSRKKVSNHTMNQRYIGVVGLLKFIDRKNRGDYFANMIWMIKRYPLQKIKHDDVKIGFEVDDEQKIEDYLASPLAGSSAKEIKIRAFMMLMIRSGLRASEAIGLRKDAVKLSDDGKTYSLMVLGKGNAIGKSYIKTEDFSNYYIYLMDNANSELLIPTNKGTAYDRSNLYRDIKKTLEAIGVDGKGLHIFRHHFASNFASKDGRIGVLQRLLRHSSVQTTMIYSKIREQELSDAISGI